jgi:hypothetical protein
MVKDTSEDTSEYDPLLQIDLNLPKTKNEIGGDLVSEAFDRREEIQFDRPDSQVGEKHRDSKPSPKPRRPRRASMGKFASGIISPFAAAINM